MLSKTQKRSIVISIALIISIIIWYINASWNNAFLVCFILSTTTFLIIYTPFEIYFSWRDVWYDRWGSLQLKELNISNIKIDVNGGVLYGNLIMSKNKELLSIRNAIVIISSGLSDKKEKLQNYYLPMACQGYIILTYDSRGIGDSKNLGKRSDFLGKIDDFKRIMDWIANNDNLNKLKIYSVGFSIGALTVLCGGFSNKKIEKIIAVSSISNYKENLENSHSIAKLSYFMKGINLSPSDEENQVISPLIVIKNIKHKLAKEEWDPLSKRVMLIHSRNDNITLFKNFKDLRDILDLTEENVLILTRGGHAHKKNELSLVSASLKFFSM